MFGTVLHNKYLAPKTNSVPTKKHYGSKLITVNLSPTPKILRGRPGTLSSVRIFNNTGPLKSLSPLSPTLWITSLFNPYLLCFSTKQIQNPPTLLTGKAARYGTCFSATPPGGGMELTHTEKVIPLLILSQSFISSFDASMSLIPKNYYSSILTKTEEASASKQLTSN